jgi:hypothetical protein
VHRYNLVGAAKLDRGRCRRPLPPGSSLTRAKLVAPLSTDCRRVVRSCLPALSLSSHRHNCTTQLTLVQRKSGAPAINGDRIHHPLGSVLGLLLRHKLRNLIGKAPKHAAGVPPEGENSGGAAHEGSVLRVFSNCRKQWVSARKKLPCLKGYGDIGGKRRLVRRVDFHDFSKKMRYSLSTRCFIRLLLLKLHRCGDIPAALRATRP